MDFQHLYHILLNASEDAIAAIEAQNYGLAKEILIRAEQQAEEEYLKQGETEEKPKSE